MTATFSISDSYELVKNLYPASKCYTSAFQHLFFPCHLSSVHTQGEEVKRVACTAYVLWCSALRDPEISSLNLDCCIRESKSSENTSQAGDTTKLQEQLLQNEGVHLLLQKP